MINSLFNSFDNINKKMENPLREISVKKSQMLFSFEQPDIVVRKDLDIINSLSETLEIADIGCLDNIIYISYRDLDENIMTSDNGVNINLVKLYELIIVLRVILCKCPAMEYVIAEDYIKIYLDMPNLDIISLSEVNNVLESNGFLELDAPRPYILYIRDFSDEE